MNVARSLPSHSKGKQNSRLVDKYQAIKNTYPYMPTVPHPFTSSLYDFSSSTLPVGSILPHNAQRRISSSLQASLHYCRRFILLHREHIDQQWIFSALLTPSLAAISPS